MKPREQILTPFPAYIYKAKNPTDKFILFFHGHGELGLADGSKLSLVERNGIPANIAHGHEYEENVIVPQGIGGFGNVLTSIIPYMRDTLKATHVFVTGLSEGGAATNYLYFKSYYYWMFRNQLSDPKVLQRIEYDWSWWDKVTKGFAPVCGKAGGGTYVLDGVTYANPVFSTALNKPYLAFHGNKDTSENGYMESVKAVKGINEANNTEPPIAKLVTVKNGSHADAWINAYSTDPNNEYGTEFTSFLSACMNDDSAPVELPEEPIQFVKVGDDVVIISGGKKYKTDIKLQEI
jgi:hypothetical protein